MKIETNIEGNPGTIRTKILKNFRVNLIKLARNLGKIFKRKMWRNLYKILYNPSTSFPEYIQQLYFLNRYWKIFKSV